MTLGKHMRRGGIPLWGFSRSENDLQMLVKPPEVRTFPSGTQTRWEIPYLSHSKAHL